VLPIPLQRVLKEALEHQGRGRIGEAAAGYARIRSAAPNEFEGWHHGGMAALLAGRAEQAVTLLTCALQLKPSSTQTTLGLGVAHVARGDLSAAEFLLRTLTQKDPKLADAWHYLALVYQTQGRFDEAIAARKRVVTLKPAGAAGWSALGSAQSAVGRQTKALECFSKALSLDPNDLRSRLGRAMVLFKCHRVREAAAEYAAVVALEPHRLEARSFRLMALNSLTDVTRDQIFGEHVAYGTAAGNAIRTRWPNERETHRRLRVGILSPDFRDHSVAYFIEPILQHLDPDSFEIILYHDHAYVDAVSVRLKNRAAIWRKVAGQTDETVEATILADAPDILMDLAAHTGTSRLRVFARRAAPVQITYLGYPNTTGVRAMDYRFVDSVTDPEPMADAFATEKLVRFAPTAWTFLPLANAPATSPLPASTNGYVTFGAFNNFTKVTDETLRDWAQLLQAVPASRLLLKAEGLSEPAVGEPVRARLRAAGIPDERIELLSRTPDTLSHLALYARVDIALDTFPYNGTTTTCEALWMGVPVVTRGGESHAARVGISLLRAVGNSEWGATTSADYINIAKTLAGDPGKLAIIRASLRHRMRASVLLDHAGQASRFGAALRHCWEYWCALNPTLSPSPASQPELVSP
jgi:predicted O-linked N-acetylglucosamine transferase (SPINDLY family)